MVISMIFAAQTIKQTKIGGIEAKNSDIGFFLSEFSILRYKVIIPQIFFYFNRNSVNEKAVAPSATAFVNQTL
jgi:hypothetical protein